MKLNVTEKSLLGAITLAWAGLPLALHFSGSPTWAERTGPVMIGGLFVTGATAFAVLGRAARRVSRVADQMLMQAGFATITVRDAESAAWLPPQYAGKPGRIDDFAVTGEPGTTRPLHRRPNPTGFTYVYQITVHSAGSDPTGRRAEGHTVTCLETPERQWPEFTLVNRTWAKQLEGWLGQDTVDFGQASEFGRQWLVRSRDAATVRQLFTQALQAAFALPEEWCLAARGNRLFVYAPGARLLPETCLPWVEQSEAAARHFVQIADR